MRSWDCAPFLLATRRTIPSAKTKTTTLLSLSVLVFRLTKFFIKVTRGSKLKYSTIINMYEKDICRFYVERGHEKCVQDGPSAPLLHLKRAIRMIYTRYTSYCIVKLLLELLGFEVRYLIDSYRFSFYILYFSTM